MKREESSHQKALFTWAKYSLNRFPELKLLHAIPNGANVSDSHRIRLVSEGLKKGMPDIHLPVSRGGYHSLYLELKSKTGKISKEQNSMMKLLQLQGNLCLVSYDLRDSINYLEQYLNLKSDDL